MCTPSTTSRSHVGPRAMEELSEHSSCHGEDVSDDLLIGEAGGSYPLGATAATQGHALGANAAAEAAKQGHALGANAAAEAAEQGHALAASELAIRLEELSSSGDEPRLRREKPPLARETMRERGGARKRAAKTASALAKGLPMSKQRRLLVQKAERLAGELEQREATAQSKWRSVARAWNRCRIRCGDRLPEHSQALRKRQRAWRHPNSWTASGALRIAFASIGRTTQRATGQRDTRRELDAMAAVSFAFLARQASLIERLHLQLARREQEVAPRWLYVQRAWDCTPVKVSFGKLRSVLAPVSRYWWRQASEAEVGRPHHARRAAAAANQGHALGAAAAAANQGHAPGAAAVANQGHALGAAAVAQQGQARGTTWHLLTLSEFQERQRTSTMPHGGILELLGQRGAVFWPEQHGSTLAVRRERCVLLPMFLARGNASTQYAAVNQSLEPLSLERLFAACEHVPVIALSLGGDLASSNVRLKMAVAQRVSEHNARATEAGHGRVFLVDVRCSGHILHVLIEHQFRTNTLIPSLHAASFVAAQPPAYTRLLQALRQIIAEDLATGFFLGTPPPFEEYQHTRQIAAATLLRSSIGRDGPCFQRTRDLVAEVMRMLNGDWRLAQVQHFCQGQGCCDGGRLQACIDRITALMVEALFGPMSKYIPACNRWYTFAPTLAVQAAGHLCHRILPRVLERALGAQVAAEAAAAANQGNALGAAEDPEDSPFRIYVTRKRRAALAFHGAPDTLETLCVASLAAAPLEKLSLTLQHLDAEGGSVVQVVRTDSLFHECQLELWHLLNPGPTGVIGAAPQVLAMLRYGNEGQFLLRLRAAVLGLAAAVWARLEITFASWPWRVLRCLAHEHDLHQNMQDSVAECAALWQEDACCLDEWWSTPLRAVLQGPQELLEERWQSLLRALARHGQTTNMLVEGLLAQVKAATPVSRGRPNAERQAHLGLLTQVMQLHLERGGIDSRGERQAIQQLLAEDLLDKPSARRRGGRPDNWLRNKMRRWQGMHPDASPAEEAAQLLALQAAVPQELRLAANQGHALGAAAAAPQAVANQGYALGAAAAAPQGQAAASQGHALGAAAPQGQVAANAGHALGAAAAAPQGQAVANQGRAPGAAGADEWLRQIGTAEWPVSEDVLEGFLTDCVRRRPWQCGIAGQMAEARWQRRQALFVQDRLDIPDHVKFRYRHHCSSAHPGVCVTKDRDIILRVRQVAGAIERFCEHSSLGTFLKLYDRDKDRTPPRAPHPCPCARAEVVAAANSRPA